MSIETVHQDYFHEFAGTLIAEYLYGLLLTICDYW